jgi:nudix-type nucleoside diphosphatase (YffH/AdpP family)
VLLIEQFRAGIWRRGDPHPWSLEVIAGRIDGGETPEAAAIREAREEAGLHVSDLLPIASYYASPGATTEYLTSFVGLVDLSGMKGGVGGLASEDEDIRALVVPFETLMEAVSSGEAENGPLLISALWLAARRAGFRSRR